MDLFLLYVTAWWINEPARIRRWVFSSAVCAIFPVIITYLDNYAIKLPGVLAAVLELALLVWMAYRPENLESFLKELATFILMSAFTAGMLFMLISVFMLYILFRLLRVSILKQELRRTSVVNATLVHNGRVQEIKALYDTGNHLVSPYTGEPVAVISEELSECLGLRKDSNPVLIPYHSIGGDGLLEAYRLELLQFKDGSTRKNFLAAVSGNICTDKEIQMILNNQHMAEGGHNA